LYPSEKVEKLAQELSDEDKVLKNYIDKGRLGQWFPGMKKWAMDAATRERRPEQDDEMAD
jgi:hypothetical protein